MPTLDELDLSHLTKVNKRESGQCCSQSLQLGEATATEHSIDLVLGARQPYRAGPEWQKIIQSRVDNLLSKGCLEPVQTEWASPVVLATKPDGSMLFCIDYTRLNALTVKDSYPLPR